MTVQKGRSFFFVCFVLFFKIISVYLYYEIYSEYKIEMFKTNPFKNDATFTRNDSIVTKYGTTLTDEEPSVLYLRTKAKITPINAKITYETDVENIKNQFTNYVNEYVLSNQTLQSDYLFNIDISSKNIRFGKISFLRYNLFLKPKVLRKAKDYENTFKHHASVINDRLKQILYENGINS